MDLSIIIPTMNEEESIGQVLDSIRDAMEGEGIEYQTMIVDTNSKDRTREIAEEKGAIVVDEPRRGYGRAYKTGFERAEGRYIATLDADCTYPAEEIPRLYRKVIGEGLDFLTTNRFGDMEAGAMRPLHIFGNKVLTWTANILFSLRIRDSQSGMWVFRKDALSKLELTDDGMPLSEEIKIEAFKKLRAVEVPIAYRCRVGEVKLSSFGDGRKNFLFLFRKRSGRVRRNAP
jgi:glycosyltransferase involved in cell wall biosynthesis